MNPAKLSRSVAAALLVVSIFSIPASAAKRRSVQHRVLPNEFTVELINGVVLDAVTGAPVISVEVTSGTRYDATNTQGLFDLKNVTGRGEIIINAVRSGYLPVTVSVKPGAPTNLTIRMTPTPTTTVRLTSGEVKVLDTESIKFGYPLFTGYIESDAEDFCKITDSTKVRIEKAKMAKLVGPAQTVVAGACCTGNAQKMTLTLKTGEVMEVIFTDTCQERYKVDVGGREHANAQFVHLLITDIAEIVFP
jgi:hypothetical protein